MLKTLLKLAVLCAMAAVPGGTQAQTPAQQPAQPAAPEATVKVGDKAPEFALQGSDGKVHKLADYKGKTVVLAWFPKAFTGG
jgi:peroxiredoxin Q/BCP